MQKEINIRPIHPFPARMASTIAWEYLKNSNNHSLRVLDPMIGSGTTAVVARSLGHKAIGFDTDPLAVLIANGWCTDIDEKKLIEKSNDVLDRAIDRYKKLPTKDAYPQNADKKLRAFVRYWFDRDNRRQLAALSTSINNLHNTTLKSLLWCAFSRLVITKKNGVSLAMDISHSRPHRVYKKAPIKPFDKFIYSVESLLKSSPFKNSCGNFPIANIQNGDARNIPLKSRSVDIVITSPPYLNAIDYLRGHKFSLIWMGHPLTKLRSIRSTNIGVERIASINSDSTIIKQALDKMGNLECLPSRTKGMLIRYIYDINSMLSEISRVLIMGGKAVLVVGDSTIYGTFVKNSQAIKFLGREHGLMVQSLRSRIIPDNRRYLPPPTSNRIGPQLQRRMKKEMIITFELSV